MQAQEESLPFTLPRTPVEQTLALIWAEVLGRDAVGIHDNFIALGGNSLLAIQILFKAQQAGLECSPTQIFDCLTIAELALVMVTAEALPVPPLLDGEAVPLTPMQKIFLEGNERDHHQFNIAYVLHATVVLDPTALKAALAAVVQAHDALRLRFRHTLSGWHQWLAAGDADVPLTVVDLSAVPTTTHQQAIHATAVTVQASLDLEHGPLWRVVLFHLGATSTSQLLVTIHHLVADAFSFNILLNDLQIAYEQAVHGTPIYLPAVSTPFSYWAARLKQYATPELLARQLRYWQELPWERWRPLPKDFPEGRPLIQDGASGRRTGSLSVEGTKLLFEAVPEGGIPSDVVLLAALVQTVTAWTSGQPVLLERVELGRTPRFDDINLSRTVGWMANNPLLFFDIGTRADPGGVLTDIDAQLQRIPSRTIGYFGLLCYLEDAALIEKLRDSPPAQVFFNFLGRLNRFASGGGLLTSITEAVDDTDTTVTRDYKTKRIELIAAIEQDQLLWQWNYNPRFYQASTIDQLNADYERIVQAMVTYCLGLRKA